MKGGATELGRGGRGRSRLARDGRGSKELQDSSGYRTDVVKRSRIGGKGGRKKGLGDR